MKKLLATLSQQTAPAMRSIAMQQQSAWKTDSMADTSIENLTIEQKATIPEYREKWRAIALAPGPIDRDKAAKAIESVYAAIGQLPPKIVFFDSPYAALRQPKNILAALMGSLFRGKLEKQLGFEQASPLRNLLEDQLEYEAMEPLKKLLWGLLASQLALQLGNPLWTQLRSQLGSQNDNCIQPEHWAAHAGVIDYCISVLHCDYDLTKWQAFESLVKNCGWIFPWEKTCFVCDRPIKLCFDTQRLLHAEAEPAILFADGFSVYAYRGIVIPEKYGSLRPSQWQTQWILEEGDLEVKRALIQGIGKLRIRRELGNIDLDV